MVQHLELVGMEHSGLSKKRARRLESCVSAEKSRRRRESETRTDSPFKRAGDSSFLNEYFGVFGIAKDREQLAGRNPVEPRSMRTAETCEGTQKER